MRRKDPFPGHPPYSAAWTALWVWGRPSPGSCVAGACGQGRGGRTCAEPAEGPGGGGNRARPVPAGARSSRGWRGV